MGTQTIIRYAIALLAIWVFAFNLVPVSFASENQRLRWKVYNPKDSEDIASSPPPNSSALNSNSIFKAPDIHGFYQSRNYFDKRKDTDNEETAEIRQQLRLEFSSTLPDKLKYHVSTELEYDLAYNETDDFTTDEKRIKLWECYFNYFVHNTNIRIGKQAIRWGKSDEINPTDNFTPQDWTEYLNLSRAERKILVWMAKIDHSYKSYLIEAIWMPFFVSSRIPEAGSDWEPFLQRQYRNNIIPFRVRRPERPSKDLESQVAAIKVKKSTSAYDLSLSYAYHYDELPALYVEPPVLFRGIPVRPIEVYQLYHRQHTIGSDFETLIGKVGLRGEFAYTIGDLFVSYATEHPDTVVEKDSLQGIVGMDYTYRDGIYLNFQYLATFIPRHESGMHAR